MKPVQNMKPGPEVLKLFFIINSAEHEIYPAHKSVKMPTSKQVTSLFVGILVL